MAFRTKFRGSGVSMQIDFERRSFKFVDRRADVTLDDISPENGLDVALVIGDQRGEDTVPVEINERRRLAENCGKGPTCP